eukprot:1804277-Amphidinium_carterae.1
MEIGSLPTDQQQSNRVAHCFRKKVSQFSNTVEQTHQKRIGLNASAVNLGMLLHTRGLDFELVHAT